MPYVLELVDTTFSQANRKLTMPLIDIDIDEVIAGKEFFDELLVEFDDLILFWIHGAHKWKTAIGLNYIIKSNRQDLLEKIDWDKIQNTIFIDQLFNRIEDKSGKILLDELRMTGVKKEKGRAFRLSSSMNFADLLSISSSYERKDADFHLLQERLGLGQNSESYHINSTFNPDLFLPSNWGIKTPVSINYTHSLSSVSYTHLTLPTKA